MATTSRIGHDKRSNTIYRRTETGEDIIVTRIETVAEIDRQTGEEVLREVEVLGGSGETASESQRTLLN